MLYRIHCEEGDVLLNLGEDLVSRDLELLCRKQGLTPLWSVEIDHLFMLFDNGLGTNFLYSEMPPKTFMEKK